MLQIRKEIDQSKKTKSKKKVTFRLNSILSLIWVSSVFTSGLRITPNKGEYRFIQSEFYLGLLREIQCITLFPFSESTVGSHQSPCL